ncbi:hypothetical protein JCM19241_1134 [Vibrio ishigakensis]|uniref:Uncharacterized protein n=1 Tax=Vibrio ishigakensis TaxID=1481914 RepID=A0A0B8Q853_9VIBR|nr:hypothetical protein JCM19241_1134 [Vibrio ishigakensis]
MALYIVGLEDRMDAIAACYTASEIACGTLEFLGMSFHRKGVRAAFINPELSVDEMQFACKNLKIKLQLALPAGAAVKCFVAPDYGRDMQFPLDISEDGKPLDSLPTARQQLQDGYNDITRWDYGDYLGAKPPRRHGMLCHNIIKEHSLPAEIITGDIRSMAY